MSPRPIAALILALTLSLSTSALSVAQSPSPGPTSPEPNASALPAGSPQPVRSLDPSAVRLTEAALTTVATERVAVDMTATFSSPQAPGSRAFRVTGRTNMTDPKRMYLDADMTALGAGRMRFIIDGGRLLMQSDLLSSAWGLPPETWLATEVGDTDPMSAQLREIAAEQNDTALLLLYLLGTSGSVTELGSETIRGATTSHVGAMVDLELALARVPETHRAALAASVEELRLVGMTAFPAEAWVDEDGRIRRVTYTWTIASETEVLEMTIVTDLSRFGRPLDLPAPPRKRVRFVRDLQ